MRPDRSGVRMEMTVAPYVITRTSTPCPFFRVKSSTRAPSGVAPNGDRPTVAASIVSARTPMVGSTSQLHEIRNPDRALLVDAVADGDAREARHRAGARIGQLHVVGHVDLAEDEIAHAVVAAAVPFGHLRHRHLRALAEALRDENLMGVGDLPRLPLERLHVEPALL